VGHCYIQLYHLPNGILRFPEYITLNAASSGVPAYPIILFLAEDEIGSGSL
jgi:hypothetical protein